MDYVLHSENDKRSRDFIQGNDLSNFHLVNWHIDTEASAYLHKGLPSPSEFPSVLLTVPAANGFPKTLVMVTNPSSISDAVDEKNALLSAKENYIENPENPNEPYVGLPFIITPDVDGFYAAILNDAIWGVPGDVDNPPNSLRVVRPSLVLSKDAMLSNLFQPLVIQMIWDDIKLDLHNRIDPLGPNITNSIISMVESYGAEFGIPLVP